MSEWVCYCLLFALQFFCFFHINMDVNCSKFLDSQSAWSDIHRDNGHIFELFHVLKYSLQFFVFGVDLCGCETRPNQLWNILDYLKLWTRRWNCELWWVQKNTQFFAYSIRISAVRSKNKWHSERLMDFFFWFYWVKINNQYCWLDIANGNEIKHSGICGKLVEIFGPYLLIYVYVCVCYTFSEILLYPNSFDFR